MLHNGGCKNSSEIFEGKKTAALVAACGDIFHGHERTMACAGYTTKSCAQGTEENSFTQGVCGGGAGGDGVGGGSLLVLRLKWTSGVPPSQHPLPGPGPKALLERRGEGVRGSKGGREGSRGEPTPPLPK